MSVDSRKAISKKLEEKGGERGPLGASRGEIQATPDHVGRLRRFQNGVICWYPSFGAHAIVGSIHDAWVHQGETRGALGYPISDVLVSADQQLHCSCFQHGRIYWTAEAGTWTTDLVSDEAETTWVWFNAKPLEKGWLEKYLHFGALPHRVDYEADVNFTRNQGTKEGGGWGGYGCMTYALLHAVDILKDWEHPYRPAVSWHYAHWDWLRFVSQTGAPPTVGDLASSGFATEASCHSDWDTEFHETGTAISWDEPSQTAKNETPLYRVDYHSPTSCTDPEEALLAIKQALRAYGPVWCAGEGHAKVIIGYDDDTSQLRLLDSYPHDTSPCHAAHSIGYDQVGPGRAVSTFSVIENLPSDAHANGTTAYSARIRIEGNWRGTYTVSLGVEGKEPLVVWTTRGREVHPNTPLEHGRLLALDTPLPDYAAQCWPPSAAHRWFLRVEDHDRDGAQGVVKEFTLARRWVESHCHSLGKYRTQTYGGAVATAVPDPASGPQAPAPTAPSASSNWPTTTPNPSPGIATVFIPAILGSVLPPPSIHLAHSITLRRGKASVSTLSGHLHCVALDKPAAGKEVGVYEMRQDTCVNQPATWILRRKVTTNSAGDFKVTINLPDLKSHIYAAAFKIGDEVIASSEVMVVRAIKPRLPQVVLRKDWVKVLPEILPMEIRELVAA